MVALATNRTRWLIHRMIALSIVFGLAFNVIGPVRFIAERNVERMVNPALVPPDGHTGLDVYFLAGLGTDADIVLAEAIPKLPLPVRAATEAALRDTAAWRASDPGAWQDWNYSRERARTLFGGL